MLWWMMGAALAREPLGRIEAGSNELYVGGGLEPTPVATVGYARGLERLAVGGTWTVPFRLLDGKHHRVQAWARVPVVDSGTWALYARGATGVSTAATPVFGAVILDVDGWLVGGRYGERGWVGLELSAAHHVAGWLAPTDLYRDHAWAEAEQGWYRGLGTTWSLGPQAGVRLSDWQLSLRAGIQVSGRGQQGTAPIHVTGQVSRRF